MLGAVFAIYQNHWVQLMKTDVCDFFRPAHSVWTLDQFSFFSSLLRYRFLVCSKCKCKCKCKRVAPVSKYISDMQNYNDASKSYLVHLSFWLNVCHQSAKGAGWRQHARLCELSLWWFVTGGESCESLRALSRGEYPDRACHPMVNCAGSNPSLNLSDSVTTLTELTGVTESSWLGLRQT